MAEKKTRSPRAKRTPSTRTRKSAALVTSESLSRHWSDEEIARLAYDLWERRGRPMGSPDEDWHQAKEQLKESSSLPG
jgi:DUF2934 family protein